MPFEPTDPTRGVSVTATRPDAAPSAARVRARGYTAVAALAVRPVPQAPAGCCAVGVPGPDGRMIDKVGPFPAPGCAAAPRSPRGLPEPRRSLGGVRRSRPAPNRLISSTGRPTLITVRGTRATGTPMLLPSAQFDDTDLSLQFSGGTLAGGSGRIESSRVSTLKDRHVGAAGGSAQADELREAMIAELRGMRVIRSDQVADAFRTVPRRRFRGGRAAGCGRPGRLGRFPRRLCSGFGGHGRWGEPLWSGRMPPGGVAAPEPGAKSRVGWKAPVAARLGGNTAVTSKSMPGRPFPA